MNRALNSIGGRGPGVSISGHVVWRWTRAEGADPVPLCRLGRMSALPCASQEIVLACRREVTIEREEMPFVGAHDLDGECRCTTGRDGTVEQATLRVGNYGTEVIIAQFIQQR